MRASAVTVQAAFVMLCGGLAFGGAGCATRPPENDASPAAVTAAATMTATAAPTALPEVSPPAKASPPSWISAVSPTGLAADGSQIRVRFANDVVPVEALEAPDRADVLSHFTIEPALPGRFIILTPRMIAFQADARIPAASRIAVRLTAGLADRSGNKLASDYAWSFTTEPLALSGLPSPEPDSDGDPLALQPSFGVDANTDVDVPSLLEKTHLISRKDKSSVAVEIAPTPTPDPSAPPAPQSDASGVDNGQPSVHYVLRPVSELAYGTKYDVVIDAGVKPAYGNVAAPAGARGRLRTHGAFTFDGVTYAGDARFAKGSPQLNFSNPIDTATFEHTVSMDPTPSSSLPLAKAEDDAIPIDPDVLAPDRSYTVTVGQALTDTFGQKLEKNVTAKISTGDLSADIWAPSGLSIFPAGANLALNVTGTNLPQKTYNATFRVLKPEDLVTASLQYDSVQTLLPSPQAWPATAIDQPLNTQTTVALPLRRLLGGPAGMLAYGISARTKRSIDANGKPVWVTPQFFGAVGITDLGTFAQWFPDGGFVRVTQLSSGAPVAGATVDVYESYVDRTDALPKDVHPCASGVTGADGTWAASASAFAPCASVALQADQAPPLLTIVRKGGDWSYARTSAYGDNYSLGIGYQGWSAGTPISHGTIFSDRTLYQPGETAKLAAIAYFDIDGVLGRGKSTSYKLVASTPSGAKIPLGTGTPDAFGVVDVSYAFAKTAEVGTWSIAATGQHGEEIDGSLQVAQFKPPNFKVDLSLDRAVTSAGSTVAASSASDYLFGAPVEGGTSHVTVTRERTYFSADGFEGFTFGPDWFYPEEPPSPTSDVLQKDLTIGADGKAAFGVDVAADLPFPMAYTVVTQTTDVSNLAVSDTKSFTAIPGDAIIGIASPFVATAGAKSTIRLVVLDVARKPVSGRALTVTLQQRVSDVATQVVEGSETPRETVHYVDVSKNDVTSGDAPVSLDLTAPKAGDYRIVANFASGGTDATATTSELWVTGTGEAAWFANDNKLAATIKLDKSTYAPGDVATALVQSPYPSADLYFSVVRHGVMYRQTAHVTGSAPQIRFTVTPQMLPNAAVQAVLVRRGPSLATGIPQHLDALTKIGFANFSVKTDAKYLKVEVKSGTPTVAPAGTQTVNVALHGADGKPVVGEVVVAVVNDAILQLSGYRFPDLVKTVYAQMPISTRVGDNRGDVKLVTEHEFYEKGQGFGGGEMAGPAGTKVRRKFVPLAYWNAALKAGADGNATATFTLPDDLTTWRVMAVGLTGDARFGNGETTFVSTKPLITNPIVPQFARPGDHFSAGVEITRTGGVSGDASVRGTLGGGIGFAAGDPHASATSQPLTQSTEAVRFDVVASGTGDANFGVTSSAGGQSDAFEFPIPIVLDDAFETAVTTGTTTTTASVPLDVASDLHGPLGGLDVTLASTLLADAQEPVANLDTQPDPFSTVRAGRLAIAADATMLDKTYGVTAPIAHLATSAQTDLGGLARLQLPSGAISYWPGDPYGDLYTTAYAVRQLAQARAAGFDVSGVLPGALRFLHKGLANPIDVRACTDHEDDGGACLRYARVHALEALGAAGDARSDFLPDIDAHASELSYDDRVAYARFLLRVPDWHARGVAKSAKLFETVDLTGRHGAVDYRTGTEGEAAAQAAMLDLAIASGMKADDIDRLLQTLLDKRHDGHWGCTCEDASAMNALVAYAKQNAQPPNFLATASLPSDPVQNVHDDFHGYHVTTVTHVVPIDKLHRGASNVSLGVSGSGTLHYVVALRYTQPASSPGIYEGIRIDRILRAPGNPAPLATFGIAKVAAAPQVDASHVYDIEDRLVLDHAVDNLVITDPLPAGFEAVDQSFRIASPTDYSDRGDTFLADYQSIYRDRVLTFVSHLDPGQYAMHYLVRSVTPGTFAWPGAIAGIADAPEEFGRTAATQLIVK